MGFVPVQSMKKPRILGTAPASAVRYLSFCNVSGEGVALLQTLPEISGTASKKASYPRGA